MQLTSKCFCRINEELASKNAKLQQEVTDIKTQLQKVLDDLTTEKTTRETIVAAAEAITKKLEQQAQTSAADYITERQFRNQLVQEINTLRKQAIERSKQFSQLLDKFIPENREKEQFLEYITKQSKIDDSNWRVCSYLINLPLMYHYYISLTTKRNILWCPQLHM